MKTSSLYIASMEPAAGKLLVTMGMMEILSRNIERLGFFRPVIDESQGTDNDINLIRDKYCPDMSYEECYGFEVEAVKTLISEGRIKEFYEQLIVKFSDLQQKFDFVLCEGLNNSGFLSSFDSDINLELANHLSCPFIGVISGVGLDARDIHEEIRISKNSIKSAGCTHFATFVNRLSTGAHNSLELDDLHLTATPPVFLLPEDSELNKPTLADIQQGLKASIILGSKNDLYRPVRQFKIATMTVEHFLNYIQDGDLIIVGGDRADIILASISTLSSPNYPNIAGILLTGGFTPEKNMLRLLEGMEMPIPILSVPQGTYRATKIAESIPVVIRPDNKRKIAKGLGLFETHIDTDTIIRQADISIPTSITPIMFEHGLFKQAKSQRMHIVLPEASDERILRAADILLNRQVVDITLLGNPTEIKMSCASLGLNLEHATIINPADSEYLEEYTTKLFELRRHKGLTMEGAADAMLDVSYFGTMMVHKGHADGMVSGAIHTTGDTIRPALQIIKTSPGISVVSSVFIMCFDTKVLVYGDCAVNPDPNAEQLAEIAISSAETARMFGVEPRVAMLSYSTGVSGTGKDVDKVREATRIAQAKRPDLLIAGPIQYDAAISPEVAKTKLLDNKVAGQATVFIFPDLNTGNNTYKAVQRSAGAVAIGPILQGLNKPVNDLSRGCLVADIINTVAITAIQAQGLQ
jgi:phosphate acetyltransferase